MPPTQNVETKVCSITTIFDKHKQKNFGEKEKKLDLGKVFFFLRNFHQQCNFELFVASKEILEITMNIEIILFLNLAIGYNF